MKGFPLAITEGREFQVVTPIPGRAQIIIWQQRALVLASQIYADYGIELDAAQQTWIERHLDHYTCEVRSRPDWLIPLPHLPQLFEHLGASPEQIAQAHRVVADFAAALDTPTPTPEGGLNDDPRRTH